MLLPGAKQMIVCPYTVHNNNNNNPHTCITIEEATQPETRHLIGRWPYLCVLASTASGAGITSLTASIFPEVCLADSLCTFCCSFPNMDRG